MGNIQSDQVEQFERPHAKAQAVLENAVDLLGCGDAFTENAQGFGAKGATGVVDQKTRRIRRDRGKMPSLLGQGTQAFHHLHCRALTAHHLDDLHQGHRVEEVKAGHTLGVPAATGDLADGQG
ncbi:hypothetical protein D9M72_597660 [compost metagenome]